MLLNKYIDNRYSRPFHPGIKVNLYRDYEYRAMARCVAESGIRAVETVMVGDSYFMTHLGRDSTRLHGDAKQMAIETLPRLIAELRTEMDRNIHRIETPKLMADIPDGLDRDEVLAIIDSYKRAGAEIVKVELDALDQLWIVSVIAEAGLVPAIHLGYMPQKNNNRTYGASAPEIENYRTMIAAAQAKGARCVIFERVTEIANCLLTRYSLELGVLPYSIFSGRAALGGQSVNIWDSTVIPPVKSIFFPPTAVLRRDEVEDRYQESLIAECFMKILKLTAANVFPPSPRNDIEVDSYLEIIGESVTC